jgi:hypothetical protein
MDDRGKDEAPDTCVLGKFDNSYANFGFVRQKCRGDIENPIYILHSRSDVLLFRKVADDHLGGPGHLCYFDFTRTSDEAAHLRATLGKLWNNQSSEVPGSANG